MSKYTQIGKLLDDSQISEKTVKVLTNVMHKLPQEVQDFVIDNISILEFKHDSERNAIGYCVNIKKYDARYLIILDSKYYSADNDTKGHIIAHEIGHAYLGHLDKNMRKEQREKEADEFAAKYGFDSEENWIKGMFTLNFWTIRRIILVALTILSFLMLVFIEKFDHLLQWVVFMV
ncbi:ImmA/IrrE family metallo-endopeptidase [bacterium]|nr:ImmA/IrrE family metallo-endopeptidase [bacterium]